MRKPHQFVSSLEKTIEHDAFQVGLHFRVGFCFRESLHFRGGLCFGGGLQSLVFVFGVFIFDTGSVVLRLGVLE